MAAGLVAALLVRAELGARGRLLPKGALDTSGRLVALYATIVRLVTGMQTEIFGPYFLQVLHGQSPLIAGYLAALMAMGWILGSMLSAGRSGNAGIRAIRTGPVFVLAGLVVLLCLVPVPGGVGWQLMLICAGLLLVGPGIGVAWPHLVTNVFKEAPVSERDWQHARSRPSSSMRQRSVPRLQAWWPISAGSATRAARKVPRVPRSCCSAFSWWCPPSASSPAGDRGTPEPGDCR